MKFLIKSVSILLVGISLYAQAAAIDVAKLTCEMMENPLGISVARPRLGWQLTSLQQGDRQTAYQVLVSSSPGNIQKDEGDVWNSGKVSTSQSQLVAYGGSALQAGKRYYWKVKVWDAKGKASAWSATAYWLTAPHLAGSEAKWIGAITRKDSHLPQGRHFHSPELGKKEKAALWAGVTPLAKRSIMLRKAVHIRKEIARVTISVSGLGHYILTVNGRKIGNSEFAPLWSDYDKTVYYNIYQPEDVLTAGHNAIGVMLGNGMYNVTGDRYRKFLVSFGPPTLFFSMDIEYGDGSAERVVSDGSWKYAESPVTFNCIFGGEDYDANLEQPGWDRPGFDDKDWKPVAVQQAPKGTLRPQLASPVKEMETYGIKKAHTPKPGVYVLDMGQNLSGYPAIKIQGKKGQTVKLLVGEGLNDEGFVSQKRSGGPYYLQYTLKGEGVEEWHPHFSYYGFQYIQAEGVDLEKPSAGGERPVLLDVRSHFIYNASGEAGTFECSNNIFNKTHTLINNAVKSNWQSVFTDCPHREKLGWLEETWLNGPGLFYNYNLVQFVPKIMRDIADAQRPGGLIPSIAPEYVVFGGDFTDSPEWGLAGVVLPWMYYEYYGDPSLIETYYPVMKKYVDYLTSTSKDGIVSHGLGDWYDYGEHRAGYSKNSPIPLSATAHYYYGATLVQKAAALLGMKEDASKYETLAHRIREAYNREFFNAGTKQYATGSQYANAVSVFLDLVEPPYRQAVLDNLVADVRSRGNRLTTGDVGNRYLYQVLARNGLNDVMYAMHNHYDTPGYGFQIQFGLTTLTEQWDPRKGNSWNHFMMGQIEEWFYRTLAGIVPQSEGFRHFLVQPVPAGDLRYVEASHESLYGRIAVSWKKEAGIFTLSVTVPVNTTAEIVLPFEPASEIKVNDTQPKKAKGVLNVNREKNSVVLGSGAYVVTCKY